MADLPPNLETGDDSDVGPAPGSTPSTPGWVKVFGLIALILILLVGLIMFTGIGGELGPGRHMRSGDPGSHTPPIEHSVQQP